MFDRLANSVSYRMERLARGYLAECERRRLLSQLSIPVDTPLSLDEARTAVVLSNYRDRFRRLVDVGAHRGAFTQAMHQVFEFREIVCVEPDDTLHAELQKSIPPQVVILSEAISSEKGQAEFYFHPDRSMNSFENVGEEFAALFPWHSPDLIETKLVQKRTLDTLLDVLEPASDCDILLKLDVQGHEMDALLGGARFLDRTSAIVLEYMFWHGYVRKFDFCSLVKFLDSRNFEFSEIATTKYRGTRTAYMDAVFVRRKTQ